MSSITEFLANLHRLGFRFWNEGEKLKFSAPKGVLDANLKDQLRSRKQEIATFLKDHQRGRKPHIPALKKSSKQGPYPLSFAQQRLWFLYQLEPESAVYNLPTAIRIKGQIDLEILEHAINQLIARHDVFRTRFLIKDGVPLQQPRQTLTIHLEVETLEHSNPEEAQKQVHRRITEEGRIPFNLCEEPLIRFLVFKMNPKEHILFFNVHHIISDFWSIKLFCQELGDAYQAKNENRSLQTPNADFQFSDFVYWQKDWLADETLQELKRFWVQTLGDAEFYLELPYDLPRPSHQSIRGKRERIQFSPALTERLNQLALKHHASLFMVTLAMFQILLRWFSGKRDFLTGSDVANRNHAGMQRLQGFFVNQLVLRARVDDELSFADYLRQVRTQTLAANQHQDFPFDALVEALNPPRGNYPPVFQTKFIFQNVPAQPLDAETGLEFEVFEPQRGTAQVDLLLILSPSPQGLTGSLEYCTDLFVESTAARLVSHYQTLAKAIDQHPEMTLAKLVEWLNQEDKQLRKKQRPTFKKPGFKGKSSHSRFAKKPQPTTVTTS